MDQQAVVGRDLSLIFYMVVQGALDESNLNTQFKKKRHRCTITSPYTFPSQMVVDNSR